jgi:hypothetical protein
MAISRPMLAALIGVLLAAVTFTASRNAREASDDVPAAAPQASLPSQVKLAPQGSVKSGAFTLKVRVGSPQGAQAAATIDAHGRFRQRDKGQVPAFRVDLDLRAEGRSMRTGAVSTGDRGYVIERGKAARVPAKVWGRMSAGRGQGRPAVPAPGLDLDGAMKDFKAVGVVPVAGVPSDHYAGKLDAGRLLDSVPRLGGANGQAVPGLTPQVRQQVTDALEDVQVDLWVGKKDRILRRLQASLQIQVPESARQQLDGLKQAKVELEFELSDINRPQRIEAPANAGRLNGQGGAFGTALLGIAASTGGAPAAAGQPAQSAGGTPRARRLSTRVPAAVKRAVEQDKTVVLFFFQPGADDDAETAKAVAAVRGHGVKVFKDRVRNVARYAPIVRETGVSQAPSIVIVSRRKARLVEGFTEPDALAQEVDDARR